jgi:hypothetical protein
MVPVVRVVVYGYKSFGHSAAVDVSRFCCSGSFALGTLEDIDKEKILITYRLENHRRIRLLSEQIVEINNLENKSQHNTNPQKLTYLPHS